MSPKFERTVGSRLCFKIRGCSPGCCKQTLGERAIYHRPKILKNDFSSLGGMLSRGYCEGLNFWTTLDNSECDTGLNCLKAAVLSGDKAGSEVEGNAET